MQEIRVFVDDSIHMMPFEFLALMIAMGNTKVTKNFQECEELGPFEEICSRKGVNA